jgi:hypothetical protein
MSGSSGGYMPEISSGGNTDCKSLTFSTSLTSPVASVVLNLRQGDLLKVDLISPSLLQIFDSNGILVGSLITRYRDSIINCMNKGFSFSATVIRISGGNCEVKVICQ